MRVVAREIMFLLICMIGAFIIVQIIEDWLRMARIGRAERRARAQSRRSHPSRQEGRYE